MKDEFFVNLDSQPKPIKRSKYGYRYISSVAINLLLGVIVSLSCYYIGSFSIALSIQSGLAFFAALCVFRFLFPILRFCFYGSMALLGIMLALYFSWRDR